MKKHFYHHCILEHTTDRHLTVEDIYAAVLTDYPNAGKSTIYRNVEELVTEGKLQKIKGIGRKATFEKTKDPHAHLINTATGEVIDIPIPTICPTDLPAGFTIDHMDIRIYGHPAA